MWTLLILASLQVPAPPPAVPTPTPVTPELVIDLAKLAPGPAISLVAPAWEFELRLENAAPSVTYRTTVEIPGLSSARTKQIDGAPENMFRLSTPPDPGC